MKFILSEIQMKKLFEQSENVLEPYVIKLFKFLNEEKKKHTKRADLLQVIKNMTPYMGIPQGHELYLLELYLLNYRKDGDYKDLTKENFVDPRKQKGKTTPNTLANLYTIAQLPFKGSNLQGFWTKDPKGVPYYVVQSYGWYPIYIFKNGIWYETVDVYSSSTSKQISRANPVSWREDEYLQEKVFLLSRDEMQMLEKGANHEQVLKHKLDKLKSIEPDLQKKRVTTVSQWRDYETGGQPFKAKFKINSIDVEGDKAIVNVDILDVLKRDGNKGIPTPENYLKGELEGVTPERVEMSIQNRLIRDLRQYMGPRYRWSSELPQGSKVKFKFNHLKT